MLWTKEDLDFSHCSKIAQAGLLATFKPVLGCCAIMNGNDMREYLVELRRVIDKAIEIGDAVSKETN